MKNILDVIVVRKNSRLLAAKATVKPLKILRNTVNGVQ